MRLRVSLALPCVMLLACSGDLGDAPPRSPPPPPDSGPVKLPDGGFGNVDGAVLGGCHDDAGCGGRVVRNGKLDLLFVIDDSSSMAEEQVAMRKQFP
ncbi:MAG TPA: hypothetical protein VHM19_08975, partial [Polyangiales bacterium]|nr:hypothetical protein [Polyangiales bacterium]